jgi:hypothetical protein
LQYGKAIGHNYLVTATNMIGKGLKSKYFVNGSILAIVDWKAQSQTWTFLSSPIISTANCISKETNSYSSQCTKMLAIVCNNI